MLANSFSTISGDRSVLLDTLHRWENGGRGSRPVIQEAAMFIRGLHLRIPVPPLIVPHTATVPKVVMLLSTHRLFGREFLPHFPTRWRNKERICPMISPTAWKRQPLPRGQAASHTPASEHLALLRQTHTSLGLSKDDPSSAVSPCS